MDVAVAQVGDWRYLLIYDGDTGALVYVAVADDDGGR